MNIIKKIFHRHYWEIYMDNIYGENGVIFTVACKQCNKCGKFKIEIFYGSGKRLSSRLDPLVSLQGAENEN